MRKFLILALMGFFCSSACKKSENSIAGFVKDHSIHLIFLDQNRNNLIDQQVFDGLRLINLVEGVEKKVFDGLLDEPTGLALIQEATTGEKILKLLVNVEDKAKITTTVLQWGNSTRDVFRTEMIREGNLTSIKKVWLNDELVWDFEKEKAQSSEKTFPKRLITVVR